MKQIPLTQGQFALVDDEDFEELNKHKWYALKPKNTFYAVRAIYNINNKKDFVYMHRAILQLKDTKIHCDHRDNNGLNNQRYNLRESTHDQNQRNTSYQKNNIFKYKGVSWHKARKKYRARISFNGKEFHLGLFEDIIEAAKAYDEKAKELFGEFAWLNFK